MSVGDARRDERAAPRPSGDPLRVLHLISEMGTGGAESLVVEMVRQGEAVGWVSAVATAGGRRADELAGEGVAIHPVRLPRRSALGVLRAARDTRRAVSAFEPDILLAHNVSASVVGAMATLRSTLPVFTVFHGVAAADYPTAARLLPRTSAAVVAVSAAVRDQLRDAGMTGSAPSVIRNTVPARSHTCDVGDLRRELDIPEGAPVALCLARLVPQKRHDVLIDAWAQLDAATTAPAPVLLLAGDGPLRAELEARALATGVGERIRFLGTRSDVDALLTLADVSVLTSDWEGLPIAVLESLAAGCPVVATDVGGLREVLGQGGGTLVPPEDPAAVAAALRGLLGDPDARAAAAEAGRTVLAARHDPLTMMKEYDALMQQHLERASP